MITNEQAAELRKLEEARELTPDTVIAHARREDNPLHPLFDWDVERAAMEHWRERAREIIRSVRVEVSESDAVERKIAYVRDPSAGEHQGYVSTTRLKSNPELAREALLYELTRAAAALERAREVSIALGLGENIEKLMRHVERTHRHVERARPAAHVSG